MARETGQERGRLGGETMSRPPGRSATRPPRRSSVLSKGGSRRARAWPLLCGATVAVIAGAACRSERAGEGGGTVRSGPLVVSTAQRGEVRALVYDTLSPSAMILTLAPERGDGARAVIFTFADSVRRVTSGLGVHEQPDTTRGARLIWPDSVTAVWWTGPTAVAFTTRTGRGVYAVGDVRGDTLAAVNDTSARAPARRSEEPVPPAARARATAFVDSSYLQPSGKAAERSGLRYVVQRLVAAPGGGLVAFYTVATDSGGRRMNPSWHIMELPSGAVVTVDSVVGPVDELRESAGAWGGVDGRTFFWARRMTLEQASIATDKRQ